MPCKNYKLLGIGNPLLDVIAEIDTNFLSRYEIKMNQAILADNKHLPLYDELEQKQDKKYIAGGSVLNTVRVFQWVLGDIKNASVYMGCLGKDNNAEILKKAAAKDGVAMSCCEDEVEKTGVCGVGILDKERTMVGKLGAAEKFSIRHLERSDVKDVYYNSDVIFSSGYFLSASIDSLLILGKHCVETNKPFCLTISAEYVIEFMGEKLKKALYYADYVFMNQIEAICFAKNIAHNESLSLLEIASYIVKMSKANDNRKRTVIITRGPESTLVNYGNDLILNIEVPKLDKSDIIDLNGAGDAFVGGFLAQMVKGGNLQQIVETGHKAARAIIQQSGVNTIGRFE